MPEDRNEDKNRTLDELPKGPTKLDSLQLRMPRTSIPAYLKTITFALTLALAGCALNRPKPDDLLDNRPAASAPADPATPDKESTKIFPYELTKEKTDAYKAGLDPKLAQSLTEKLTGYKDPDRILRVLTKYNIELSSTGDLDILLQSMDLAADAIELMLDSICPAYNLKIDRQILLDLLDFLKVREFILRANISSALSGQAPDLQNKKLYDAYSETVRKILKEMLTPEIKAFIENFPKKLGVEVEISFELLGNLAKSKAELPRSDGDWQKAKEIYENLNTKFGLRIKGNELEMILFVMQNPQIIKNLESIDKAGIPFEDSSAITPESFSALTTELPQKFFTYLKWYTDNFAVKMSFPNLSVTYGDFHNFEFEKVDFNETLTAKIRETDSQMRYQGAMGPLLYYVLHKEAIDNFASSFGVSVTSEDLRSLTRLYKSHIHQPVKVKVTKEGVEKEVAISLTKEAVRPLIDMFYKFRPSYAERDKALDNDDKIQSLDRALGRVETIFKDLPPVQVMVLVNLAKYGDLRIDPMSFDTASIAPLLKALDADPKALREIIGIHNAFKIKGGMTIEE
ncbi:hypothetical protein HY605_00360, partial [Candidatus Peregrinibacteria bacterium]|nr:hypothetical protein [Candidatus Peregrinibacteria bacterium]